MIKAVRVPFVQFLESGARVLSAARLLIIGKKVSLIFAFLAVVMLLFGTRSCLPGFPCESWEVYIGFLTLVDQVTSGDGHSTDLA